jgi:hypothetical protein
MLLKNDTLTILPELETKMSRILGAPDQLEANDFDPIEFINGIFPNGTLLNFLSNSMG